MKVCVLQPDYGGSRVAYRNFDPPRNLAPLLPDCAVDHLFLHKLSVYGQLREAAARGYDIYVNLCEGYLDWDIPSIDVIWSLDLLGLPYTGPTARLYDPSKPLMYFVAGTRGVRHPSFVEAADGGAWITAARRIGFPLFVKPAHAGDSLGIDAGSCVAGETELLAKAAGVIREHGRASIEEYLPGREFTVLVVASDRDGCEPVALAPIEFVFGPGPAFKTYPLKVEQHNPDRNVPVAEADLDQKLRSAARAVFAGFDGEGYARLDFRLTAEGEPCLIDVNFACSVFYPEGFEGSADYILRYDPMGPDGFLRHIIAEGLARHGRRAPKYERRLGAISGFGIFAARGIRGGELVAAGEGRTHKLVTAGAMPPDAIPLAPRIGLLPARDPRDWPSPNHSCEPNMVYRGLDLVALRDIPAGEELTLDYGLIYDDAMPPFACRCGAPHCRGEVHGKAGNSILGSDVSGEAAPRAAAGSPVRRTPGAVR
jgi:hypothetical protein